MRCAAELLSPRRPLSRTRETREWLRMQTFSSKPQSDHNSVTWKGTLFAVTAAVKEREHTTTQPWTATFAQSERRSCERVHREARSPHSCSAGASAVGL